MKPFGLKPSGLKPGSLKKAMLLTLAALLVAGAPGGALAQKGDKKKDPDAKPAPPHPEFTTGIVASYNPENRTLKLNTGGEYKLSAAAGNAVFKQGDKVQIRWLMKGGVRIADQVTENMAIEHSIAAPAIGGSSVTPPASATATPTTPAATPAVAPGAASPSKPS